MNLVSIIIILIELQILFLCSRKYLPVSLPVCWCYTQRIFGQFPTLHFGIDHSGTLVLGIIMCSYEKARGHAPYNYDVILPSMIIPPKTDNYLIEAFCSGRCTEKVRDISLLFTKAVYIWLKGHGLRVQHFRWNKECNVTEELRSIDKNFRYDFNYQVL